MTYPGGNPNPTPVSDWTGLFSVKHVLQCWALGFIAVIVALSTVVPTLLFSGVRVLRLLGVFTVPVWILPSLIGLGVHNNILTLFLMFLGGSLFYGAVCFIV